MENVELHTSEFYGVYLLRSQSPEKRFNGRCYIGYTVNPNRRINQHNRGKEFGGAKKTSKKGPWQMVMIVHGFPNNISALQFEWAWQQPKESLRLKYKCDWTKRSKESYLDYNFRVLSVMLNTGPWNRLPLTIRWLATELELRFEPKNVPPYHMKIIEGKIKVNNKKKKKTEEPLPQRNLWAMECHLCMKPIENPERSRIGCVNASCKLTCHIVCMAEHMLLSGDQHKGHYIPIDGECPICQEQVLWADLLKSRNKVFPEEIEYDFEDLVYVDDDDSDL